SNNSEYKRKLLLNRRSIPYFKICFENLSLEAGCPFSNTRIGTTRINLSENKKLFDLDYIGRRNTDSWLQTLITFERHQTASTRYPLCLLGKGQYITNTPSLSSYPTSQRRSLLNNAQSLSRLALIC